LYENGNYCTEYKSRFASFIGIIGERYKSPWQTYGGQNERAQILGDYTDNY
jgi:hypothetical protein